MDESKRGRRSYRITKINSREKENVKGRKALATLIEGRDLDAFCYGAGSCITLSECLPISLPVVFLRSCPKYSQYARRASHCIYQRHRR